MGRLWATGYAGAMDRSQYFEAASVRTVALPWDYSIRRYGAQEERGEHHDTRSRGPVVHTTDLRTGKFPPTEISQTIWKSVAGDVGRPYHDECRRRMDFPIRPSKAASHGMKRRIGKSILQMLSEHRGIFALGPARGNKMGTSRSFGRMRRSVLRGERWILCRLRARGDTGAHGDRVCRASWAIDRTPSPLSLG
jgi:hypothetical protein